MSHHRTGAFSPQGFNPAYEHRPAWNAAGIRATAAGRAKFDPPPRPSGQRLVQTGIRVESDVLFHPRINRAVAVLRQYSRP